MMLLDGSNDLPGALRATPGFFMGRVAPAVVAVAVVALVPGSGRAQVDAADAGEEPEENTSGVSAPADRSAERGRTIEISEENVEATVRRPEGWVNVDSESRAVVAFQSTADERAKVEVRLSTPVRGKKKQSFFNSFHSELKAAGFQEVRDPTEREYGDKTGRETEYEGETANGAYRLVVWTFYRDRTAWIVAGFFRGGHRDLHYSAFQSVANTLSFERSDDN